MKNISLFLFSLVRIVMLVILSFYFLQLTDGKGDSRTIYIIAAIPLFIVSHFIQMANVKDSKRILCSVVDFIVIAGFGFLFADSGYLYLIFFGVLSTTVFLLYEDRKILGLFSGAFVGVWLLISFRLYAETGIFSISSNIVNGMFVIYGAFVGGLIQNFHGAKETIAVQYGQLNASHEALQDAHRQLHEYAGQVEQLTVIRERNEIAREIHDTVGHKMTALVVQLQVASEMAQRDPLKARDVLAVCEQLTRDSLHEIRVSVRTLKEDAYDVPFHQTLQALLDEFSDLTHMKTELHLNGDASSIPRSLQSAIKRIVQEGLTNAKKHGNADVCIVSVHQEEDKLHVDIKDDGKGQKNVIPNFGLINMKERVEEQNGSFEIQSIEGDGFRILVSFPLQETVAGVMG